MCGITGFMATIRGRLPSEHMLDAMTDSLAHRGPDSRGVWYDGPRGVGLGQRRLAIRDLSPAGAQPMTSSCGRFVIVYNGEVYSQDEIAKDLASALKSMPRALKGSSDTEIILEAIAHWGLDEVLPQLNGMFAFALYDRETGGLSLVRDRIGIKPLYWSHAGGLLVFGSELKALGAVAQSPLQIDRNALASFVRHNYIPAPHTIYKGVHKLEPGTMATVSRDGTVKLECYWDQRAIVGTLLSRRVEALDGASETEQLAELDGLLCDAVARRMVSDVPLGALLSGGIDSSLVTALMTEASDRPIKSFSIGFTEAGFDEAPHAKAVAAHLGTDHTELYVEPGHALDLVAKLPTMYDEPFADSSQIPTALVCEMTRAHVTVALSGDGGDELFAGYNHYTIALDMWKKAGAGPKAMSAVVARAILSQRKDRIDGMAKLLPARLRRDRMGDKAHKFARAMLTSDPQEMYRSLLSHWDDPGSLVIGATETKGVLWDAALRETMPDLLDRMQFLDSVTYLPDDILTKVDRASMAVSLEVRVPLLDHRVVECAWSLPQNMKRRGQETKWALRQILYKRVPRPLIERPKRGFSVPIAQWLRGPLRDWGEHLLDESRLKQQGLFAPALVRNRWQAHLDGDDWAESLWSILMAQAWIEANAGVTL